MPTLHVFPFVRDFAIPDDYFDIVGLVALLAYAESMNPALLDSQRFLWKEIAHSERSQARVQSLGLNILVLRSTRWASNANQDSIEKTHSFSHHHRSRSGKPTLYHWALALPNGFRSTHSAHALLSGRPAERSSSVAALHRHSMDEQGR